VVIRQFDRLERHPERVGGGYGAILAAVLRAYSYIETWNHFVELAVRGTRRDRI
jgi:hypothetical protein